MSLTSSVISFERLRDGFEAAPNPLLLLDADNKVVFANQRLLALLQCESAELVERDVDTLVPGVAKVHVASELRPGASRVRWVGLRRDGSKIPLEVAWAELEQGDGWTLALFDVTERAQLEEWFERMLDAGVDASIVVEAGGRILLVNRAAEQLLGYERAALIGQSIEVIIPERFARNHAEHVQRFFGEPRARPMGAGRDLYLRRKDGRELQVEVGLSPLAGPSGALVTRATVFDISARKEREAELRRSNAELEQFAYIASHDLQEPLRMVANFTELLAQRYNEQLDERAQRYIEHASEGARRMQQLVADLLAYARIDSQAKPLTAVSSEALVRRVRHYFRAKIEAAGAQIETGRLPLVLADELQLEQLLQNLIGNALKFRSEAALRIVVRAEHVGSNEVLSVADNGIGLDMLHAERIFRMFQRLHAREEYEGNGIGLTIAKRIVERHGGRIWVESTPGQGSTFFFTLTPAPA